jgi:hypothetical protein
MAYVITKISASIFAGAILFEAVVGWNLYLSVPLIMLLTGC